MTDRFMAFPPFLSVPPAPGNSVLPGTDGPSERLSPPSRIFGGAEGIRSERCSILWCPWPLGQAPKEQSRPAFRYGPQESKIQAFELVLLQKREVLRAGLQSVRCDASQHELFNLFLNRHIHASMV